MVLVACVDDSLGLLFNHRRQSRDRLLRQRLLERAGEHKLWMNAYSAAQFADAGALCVDEDFLQKAAPGDFCFVENIDPAPFEEQVEQIILYRWNRSYPADLFFTLPLAEHGWQKRESTDFPGFSHETITEEVYTR